MLKMHIEQRVGDLDQLPVEPLLIDALLHSAGKQNRLSCWIKRKCDSNDKTAACHPQFLHVLVL